MGLMKIFQGLKPVAITLVHHAQRNVHVGTNKMHLMSFTREHFLQNPVHQISRYSTLLQRLIQKNIGTNKTCLVNNTRGQTLQNPIHQTPRYSTLPSNVVQSQMLLPKLAFNAQQVRTKTYFSYKSGRPRTVRAVIHRFFRLHNGQWIRTRAGRRKRLWAKSPKRKNRLLQHVQCNPAQSRLLDRMVGKTFKKPRYYPDDPYEPYHKLENLPNYHVLRNKPKFLP